MSDTDKKIFTKVTAFPSLEEIKQMPPSELATLKLQIQGMEEYVARLIREKIQR